MARCDAYGNCYSSWDSWARWVVLGVIIIGALVIFFLFSCLSARRRRKMGYAPYRGTGWAVGSQPPPQQYQQPYYASNYNAQPPPAYGQNQGYYAPQRETDVEMQPPQNVYNNPYGSNQGMYAPPPGAPPGKTDGIIR